MEPIAVTRPNPTLPRARSLVRNEAVALDHNRIGEFRCVVSAGKKIETAVLSLPRYSERERKSVLRIVARHTRGGVTSGDLPDEVHAELIASKLSPVPEATETSCTCSGRIEPCLHVTAATYAISLIVDQMPTSALAVRGVDLAAAITSKDVPRRWMPIDNLDGTAFFG
ncbi:hypothetical protein CH251_16950 [Rhodococcus sp. 06-462-5]|uniref:hypothetical protein n=1 Tax=unclassified Rhodococcus (in: high G+C Gram-positive bacteria) TaxID=192944 RepID=UPI000B9A22FA|nr:MULTISPECIES: hypothetical protein [unclassified Rhodococcus (in: high G+C Gram-positive bacteria)]OZC70819.1 hypothetical protein CH251_16950 [Rhodococcus sp. 06-462-5]OZE68738.1 hypothetical protein CH270_02850 [Rhodococcus sp. 02-925g]